MNTLKDEKEPSKKRLPLINKSILHDAAVVVKTIVFVVFMVLVFGGVCYFRNYKINIITSVQVVSPIVEK